MPALRLMVVLVLLALASGCSSDNSDLQKANETIARLQSEIQKLQLQNAELERHEEMLIGEIAFSQGCRLLVNICLGLDSIGAELVQQGKSAHGSAQFLMWAAFKIFLLLICLPLLLGYGQVVLHTLVTPSARKLRNARQVIKDGSTVKDQISQEKRESLAAVQKEKNALIQEERAAQQKLAILNSDIKHLESEIESLQIQIFELQEKIENLEIARKAAEAFLGRKR